VELVNLAINVDSNMVVTMKDKEAEVVVVKITTTTEITEEEVEDMVVVEDADSTIIDVEDPVLTTQREIVPMEIAVDFLMILMVVIQEAEAVLVKENIVHTVVVIITITEVVEDNKESAFNSKKKVNVVMVIDVDSPMVRMITEDNKETEEFASNSKKKVTVVTVKDADFLMMLKTMKKKKKKNMLRRRRSRI